MILNLFADLAVARYLSSSALDNGFRGEGKMVRYDSARSLDDFGYAMTQQSDGSVLVGGRAATSL